MPAGGVDDDAREDEDHPEDPGQVSEVLVRHESGVMVVCRRGELDEDVANDRQRQECQADAHQERQLVDLVPDGARGLYH